MNRFLMLMIVALISGCASLDGKFDNRVVCTVSKDKAYVVSEYGPVGVASTINKADKDVICK